jgi:3-phenylpropionate/trans-cinnamate dioxygenase ferredoxin reductase subunit
VLVVGAGWIGLETAAAVRTHGARVTVVQRDTLPLRRVLGDELATIYADLHLAHGVDFRFSSGIQEFGGLVGRLVTRCSPTTPRCPPMSRSSARASGR